MFRSSLISLNYKCSLISGIEHPLKVFESNISFDIEIQILEFDSLLEGDVTLLNVHSRNLRNRYSRIALKKLPILFKFTVRTLFFT